MFRETRAAAHDPLLAPRANNPHRRDELSRADAKLAPLLHVDRLDVLPSTKSDTGVLTDDKYGASRHTCREKRCIGGQPIEFRRGFAGYDDRVPGAVALTP